CLDSTLSPQQSFPSSPLTPTASLSALSLHDALPICLSRRAAFERFQQGFIQPLHFLGARFFFCLNALYCLVSVVVVIEILIEERSEEHTSELQSRENLVCRLLLEKKK